MKTPDQALNDALCNPFARLFLLFSASYLVGIFYRVPWGIYYSVMHYLYPRDRDYHLSSYFEWIDLSIYPLLTAPFFGSFLLALPISVFCIYCSAMDWWQVSHTTALGSCATFAMYFSSAVESDYGPVAEAMLFAISISILFGIYLGGYTLYQRRPISFT